MIVSYQHFDILYHSIEAFILRIQKLSSPSPKSGPLRPKPNPKPVQNPLGLG